MAQPLQHDPTALIIGYPAARTSSSRQQCPSGSENGEAIISVPLVQNIRQVTRIGSKAWVFSVSLLTKGGIVEDTSRWCELVHGTREIATQAGQHVNIGKPGLLGE
jgi:hypothetical protein